MTGNTNTIASVIIPAHNEEQHIARTLHALTADTPRHLLEIIVVCNGCTDRTSDAARAVARQRPEVRVVEIATASKVAALREGDRLAQCFPRIYLDGDITLTSAGARGLVEALSQPGALVAGIPGEVDVTYASAPARWYYDFRARLPVLRNGIIGAGVYAISGEGRSRFDSWPDIIGDDQFVFRLFSPPERVTLSNHRTVVDAAPTVRKIIKRGVRVRRGNAQLTAGAGGVRLAPPRAGFRAAFSKAARRPSAWPGAVTFVVVTALIRLRSRIGRGGGDWA